MKQLFSILLMLAMSTIVLHAQTGNAKKGNYKGPGGTQHEVVKGKNVVVSYGRPMKKGRDIFGALVPYGEVWRTGADEATEITFDKDVMFGGKKVVAGTYSLFTIPGKEEWTIIINKELKQWGAYKYNEKNDVVRATAPARHMDKPIEQFTMTPKDGELVMEWDATSVAVPMKF